MKQKELIFIILLGVFIFLSIGLLIGLLVHIFVIDKDKLNVNSCPESRCLAERLTERKPIEGEQVEPIIKTCTNERCISIAARFLQSMNQSTDPCDNLYELMCGNYKFYSSVPDSEMQADIFTEIDTTVSHRIRKLLREEKKENELEAFIKAKQMYNVCMNIARNDETGFKIIEELLKLFGEWPLVLGIHWQKPADEISRLLGNVNKFGLSSEFINIRVAPDEKQTSINRITIDKPRSIPDKIKSHMEKKRKMKDGMTSSTSTVALFRFISAIAGLFGNVSMQTIMPEIQEIVKLSADIEKITTQQDDPLRMYNKRTVSQLSDLTRHKINWELILSTMFDDIKTITPNEVIVVKDLNYFKQISNIWEKYRPRTITNYIIWNVIRSLVPHFPSAGIKIYSDYMKEAFNLSLDERWKFCVYETVNILNYPVSRMYIDRYVDSDIVNLTKTIIQQIVHAYKELINSSTSYSEETKINAMKKLDNLNIKVGFPDWIFDNKKLNDSQETIYIADSYLSTVLQNSITSNLQKLQSLEITSEANSDWIILSATAFYNAHQNSITFPLVILSEPFIDKDLLMAINFGALGSLVGHQISHAYDSYGHNYDDKGILNNFWDSESQRTLNNNTACYVEQYNQFCPEELNDEENKCINANAVMDDNMANDMGFKSSFKAYKTWVKDNGIESRLPGLEKFTPEQLFILSYAYFNCANTRTELYSSMLFEKSSHAPHQYRVNGVVQNFGDYNNLFNCPQPRKTEMICSIW